VKGKVIAQGNVIVVALPSHLIRKDTNKRDMGQPELIRKVC
jgi:hypothetical protein